MHLAKSPPYHHQAKWLRAGWHVVTDAAGSGPWSNSAHSFMTHVHCQGLEFHLLAMPHLPIPACPGLDAAPLLHSGQAAPGQQATGATAILTCSEGERGWCHRNRKGVVYSLRQKPIKQQKIWSKWSLLRTLIGWRKQKNSLATATGDFLFIITIDNLLFKICHNPPKSFFLK